MLCNELKITQNVKVRHVEDAAVHLRELNTSALAEASAWLERSEDVSVVEEVLEELFCPNEMELLVEPELANTKCFLRNAPVEINGLLEKKEYYLPSEKAFFGFFALQIWHDSGVSYIQRVEDVAFPFIWVVLGGLLVDNFLYFHFKFKFQIKSDLGYG